MNKRHGQFIEIGWDDDKDEVYVRGHVTEDEARDSYQRYYGYEVANSFGVKHRWARWTPASQYSDYSKLLYVYDAQGRGTFAVTELQLAGGAA